jgi:predicted metal-dependent hydrolase
MTFMQILLGETLFTWSLLFARRRTVRLRIVGPAALEIVAPPKYRQEQAEAFIQSKSTWILATAKKLAAEEQAAAQFAVEPGGLLPFMGSSYTLSVAYHPVRPLVRLDGSLLRVCLPEQRRNNQAALTQALIRWYAEQARQYLAKKTLEWARAIGVKPVSVTIRDPKTRWGSCSTRGSLSYSWRVILAPSPIIDYLIVHELCHLLEPNHSSRYWRLVESILPDFRTSRQWLKANGGVLMRLFSLQSQQLGE